jgi:hypothetical protein
MFYKAILTGMLAAPLSIAAMTAPSVAAVVHYTAHLSGRSEVPKTDSKGTGLFDGSFDPATKQLSYKLTFRNLSGPATMAHIHGPAGRKENAGVMVPLGDKNPTSPITGSVALTDDQVKALQAHRLYANVHTAANPGGEIRGQIIEPKARHHKRAHHTGTTQAPAAADTAAPTPVPSTAPSGAPAR